MMIKRLITAMMICVCVCVSQAQNVYVSSSAEDDSGAGTTWETAKHTLSAGIAAAGASGTVFVKAGNYSTDAELVIASGVSVMGGFEPSSTGTDTSRRKLPGANAHWTDAGWCSIVSGNGGHRIATVNGLLDGLVVRQGFSSTVGGGLLIDGGTVRYCVIKECDALSENETPSQGGGAYVQNNGTLLNCVVTDCRASRGAGVAGGNGSLISNTITRNTPIDCGVVTDYDGNHYNTVVLGEQCWFRENLRTTHFADGTEIPAGTAASSNQPFRYDGYVSNLTPEMFAKNGYLYNWMAVMHGASGSNNNPSGVQGVCPSGWHVPSRAEWEQLWTYVRSVRRFWCEGNSNNVVKALASTENWNNQPYYYPCRPGYNPSVNNISRFTAMPTGLYDGNYREFGNMAEFWTTTVYNNSNAYRQTIRYESDLGIDAAAFYVAYAVRCVKD